MYYTEGRKWRNVGGKTMPETVSSKKFARGQFLFSTRIYFIQRYVIIYFITPRVLKYIILI